MLTFGLNRPLFSFGLSYPGYFFVIVVEEGATETFYARGDRDYIASELVRLYPAHEVRYYEAYPTGVFVLNRNYIPDETRWFETSVYVNNWLIPAEVTSYQVSAELVCFEADIDRTFTTGSYNRTFIAQENRELET